MTVEHKPNFILITDIIDGEYVKEKYIMYTEEEAIAKFKEKYLPVDWCTGSGRIELSIKMKDADMCSHPGPCDNDVKLASQFEYIEKQLNDLDPALLAAELKEYGAWDAEQLADHEQNKQRILFIACGDISEGHHL